MPNRHLQVLKSIQAGTWDAAVQRQAVRMLDYNQFAVATLTENVIPVAKKFMRRPVLRTLARASLAGRLSTACAHCGAPAGECELACVQRRETWGD